MRLVYKMFVYATWRPQYVCLVDTITTTDSNVYVSSLLEGFLTVVNMREMAMDAAVTHCCNKIP